MIKGIKYGIPANFAGSILRMALVSVLMLLCGLFSLRAQDNVTRVKVLFPFDSDVVVENYQDNAGALSVINETFANQAVQEGLTITSYSSPEGNLAYNRNLSLRRAKSMQAYLESKYPQLQGKITLRPGEEAWEDLRIQVESDSRLSESTRSAVLSIIGKDIDADAKERELTALPEYKRLYANYFKSLRFAAIELRIENFANSEKVFANSEISDAGINGGQSAITENATTKVEKGLPVIYYALNEDFIRPQYMGNDKSMKEIIRLLRSGKVGSMVIEGTASPEGPAKGNERLAKDRAENLKNYIIGMFPELENKITVVSKGAIEGAEEEYPYLRYARIASVEMQKDTESAEKVADSEETVVPADTTGVVPADTTAVTEPKDTVTIVPIRPVVPEMTEDVQPKAKNYNTVVALKTNLLFDAVTALNFEVEVPIGERFSVMAEDVFPWWETGNKYCLQYWEIGVEGRFWFKPWKSIGTEKLRGFFVGPYVMSAKYDFQWDKSINYQGEMWSVGVSAGYSMPIGKRKKANLEFSLALGYMQSPYRHYIPTDDYSKLIHDPALDGTFYNYFLYPTKAKVSLVIPINFPTKKEVSHD